MPSQYKSGTIATTATGTEYFIGSNPETTAGAYQIYIDTSPLTAAEVIEIRVKEKATATGDTQREVFVATCAGPQGSPMWVSPPLILLHGWSVSITRTEGSARSFLWSIRQA